MFIKKKKKEIDKIKKTDEIKNPEKPEKTKKETVKNTHICYLTKSMINKMTKKPKYELFYLDLMFNDNNKEIQLAKPFLDYKESKIEKKLLIIKNENTLENIIFEIIVLPDNYENLKKIYNNYLQDSDKNKLKKIKQKLNNENFKSLFHLNKNNIQKLIQIKNDILKFFKDNFDLDADTIKIQVSDLNSNNNWLSIKVFYRDINKGNYKFMRLTEISRTVDLFDVINILEKVVEQNKSPFDYYTFRFMNPKWFKIINCK